jgi:hypothetical protein
MPCISTIRNYFVLVRIFFRKEVIYIKKKLSRFLVIAIVFAFTSVVAQPALAANPTATPSPKPGWGHGDKNHVHTGPPGISVRTDDDITVNNTVTVVAEAGAHVVVNIANSILHIMHIGA